MSVRTGRRVGTLVGALAVVLGAASVAWACTIQTNLAVTPGSGAATSAAWVYGSGFANAPVDIRWDGVNGTRLATATGPNFNVRVVIPNVSPRVYTIIAVQEGPLGSTARTAFEITSQPAPPKNVTPPAGGDSPAPDDTSPPAGGTTPESGTTPAGSSTDSASSGGTSNGTIADQAQRAAAEPAARGSVEPVTGTAAPSSSAAVAQPSRAAATRTGPLAARAGAAPAPALAPATDTRTAPAEEPARLASRSVAGDLWSGFTGPQASLGGPSLADDGSSGGGPVSGLAAGMGLLAAGIAALAVGFSAAEVRRRRVHAATDLDRR